MAVTTAAVHPRRAGITVAAIAVAVVAVRVLPALIREEVLLLLAHGADADKRLKGRYKNEKENRIAFYCLLLGDHGVCAGSSGSIEIFFDRVARVCPLHEYGGCLYCFGRRHYVGIPQPGCNRGLS